MGTPPAPAATRACWSRRRLPAGPRCGPRCGVVEGREEFPLPVQHLPARLAHRAPDRRIGTHPPRVLLVRGGGDDLVRLARVEPSVIGRVGPCHDGLGLEHLQRHGLTRLRLHTAGHVRLQRELVHHHEAIAGSAELDHAWVVAPPHPHRPLRAATTRRASARNPWRPTPRTSRPAPRSTTRIQVGRPR